MRKEIESPITGFSHHLEPISVVREPGGSSSVRAKTLRILFIGFAATPGA